MSRSTAGLMLVLLCAGFSVVAGPARAATSVYTPPACSGSGQQATHDELLRCFAPVWIAPETEREYNRIGTPELYRGWFGGTRARVNPAQPAVYTEVRRDEIAGSRVLQLVYRVHFERIPLRFSRYFFEAHRNSGLLAIVTLDEKTREPLFVTVAHTCGCYRVVMPTDRVDRAMLPEGWSNEIRMYGQSLPGLLRAPGQGGARPVFSLAATSHRITNVEVSAELPRGDRVELPLVAMETLRDMPIGGDAKGRRASLFYQSGPLRGHVRGAWNPMEGLTAFGLVSLDPTVGMDKDFGDPAVTGTPFYTSLRFWKQDESRLDRFESMLRELGFRPDGRQVGASQ